jgi:hypothetical protein
MYVAYSDTIKPLIAEIEARFEEFPISILNEIRAYNDHIARCYRVIRENPDRTEYVKSFIDSQTEKAGGHIERIILDCYKYLNIKLHETVVSRFEARTKRIDLSTVSDGTFYIEYKKLRKEAVSRLKDAKLTEVTDKADSMTLYQLVHNTYTSIEDLIIENDTHIHRASIRHTRRSVLEAFMWTLSVILSAAISAMAPWGCLLNFFK